MNWRSRRRQEAFTFVEVLAALLFLAIVIPAIVQGLTLANRASVLAERHAVAGEFAENKLNEMLVDNAWSNAPNTGGTFDAGVGGYRWQMSTNNWAADTVNQMTELAVDVYYTVQGREYKVHLSTLVFLPTTTTGTGTGTGTGTTANP